MKIEKVIVKNFKSLRDVELELRNLTLITGVNSVGKSSFIQSLLLLKQNQEKFYSFRGKKMTNINDNYVKLGNKSDILYEEAFQENVEITITSNHLEHSLVFNNRNLKLENIKLLPEEEEENFNIFFDDFQYIETDRVAPSITYGLSDEEIEKNLIGIQGEYTAHYLAVNPHKKVLECFRHRDSKTEQLLENVSLWLGDISSNISVNVKLYDELQQVNLTYSYSYQETTTRDYTPLNVGFGVTYVLPIIVAILKAKEGDLLIIENPESHLHPAGQSKIAELCAIASANGVQIIVETHSDHFLNGIRVATKKGILQPEDSKIYYFRKEQNELETKIDEINIDKDGGIDRYPKGFFDQFDEDLDKLISW